MPSDPADPRAAAGRPRWWAAGLALCLLVAALAAAGVVLLREPREAVLPQARPDAGTSAPASDGGEEPEDTRADRASALLQRLSGDLQRGSRAQVEGLAAPGDRAAARELVALQANVRDLRIVDLALRYVDEDQGRLSGAAQRALGGDAWVGRVQLSWRMRGFDAQDSRMEISVTFRGDGRDGGGGAGGASFVTARRGYGDAVPLWLLSRVAVTRTDRSLVLTSSAGRADQARFSRVADQAVRDVRKVLRDWRGRLVVEVPRDQQGLGRVLGREPDRYREIAAVTTTADGTLAPGTPVHIFVNPRVFDPLKERGSQIVMSHEATHVATRAADSQMPPWLLEGFADYVALAHVDLPVDLTASQILARVRKDGPPTHLPDQGDFDPSNQALGTSYEAAWLACRLFAERYGERRLIAFYRSADRSSSTDAGFRAVGTDERAFTRLWRADLRRLAG